MISARVRFAEAVRSRPVDLGLACLLVGAEVDPSLDVDDSLAVLDALAATARPLVPAGASPAGVATASWRRAATSPRRCRGRRRPARMRSGA